MKATLPRRVRVRDDGTGKRREAEAVFSDFDHEDAIILLGDPGMGKTTLLKETAGSKYMTVRQFCVDPSLKALEPIFIDGLDEYRTISGGRDASSEVATILCSLGKPKFRLSCRSADWYGAVDHDVLKVASTSGRVVVLELCPLSRVEIKNAVVGLVPEPDAFIKEADSAGLDQLLENPQTLELLARAWGGVLKPRNKFEAYDIGVSELLKETNQLHAPRGGNIAGIATLRQNAGTVASTLLLSNSAGLSRIEAMDGDGYVNQSIVPTQQQRDLDEVLRRRIFLSREVDRFELIHRTITEFLAAEDLAIRIGEGLPIDRVLALICGLDGKPVSSLRGLFAWLMCSIGHLAEIYVERDPYGIVTYGDASLLPPKAQCAIWEGLRKLNDPWFLADKDDSGSFRNLANHNTKGILRSLLHDPDTGLHLKIAVLEAITNSTENIEINETIRATVMLSHEAIWLRMTALKAFVQSNLNDFGWEQLDILDFELMHAKDDAGAYVLRSLLFRLKPELGELPKRFMSIFIQAASLADDRRAFGSIGSLVNIIPDTDLDVILDGMSQTLVSKKESSYELESVFNKCLKRRIECSAPITPIKLAGWLRQAQGGRGYDAEKTLDSLKTRFENDFTLFTGSFNCLLTKVHQDKDKLWLFLVHDLWDNLPASVWPFPQAEFFLSCAVHEGDPENASFFFRMYLSWFPREGASLSLAESGFDFLDRRNDVLGALGDWHHCKIPKWKIDDQKRNELENRKHRKYREENIRYLSPRLTDIRQGRDERALAWAAVIYLGVVYGSKDIQDARERLVNVTNETIAGTLIDGFTNYVDNPNIPRKKDIIDSWIGNNVPRAHSLLGLSVYQRHNSGMTFPDESLPHCIAAAVTAPEIRNELAGFNETITSWVLQEITQNPCIVRQVLEELWVASAATRRNALPFFYELKKDNSSQKFLAALSAHVLSSGMCEDDYTVGKLVTVLLHYDQRQALTIGESELTRSDLSPEIGAIWVTVLFVIHPEQYTETWQTFMGKGDSPVWPAIDLIRGDRFGRKEVVALTPFQRAQIIKSVGRRFAYVAHPSGACTGNQNPWDATEFVCKQIGLLASDGSGEAGTQLEMLGNCSGLESYREVISHNRAQYERQCSDSTFHFGSPAEVAQAILNQAPATPTDLLSYIVDHLTALDREISKTQIERHRAYWNHAGRNLMKPKMEEICSALLADDLQRRVTAHGLIADVEHHMARDKECDIVILQGTDRLLPIEVKHHYHQELWTAWRTQLDRLYTHDAKAGGLGIYLVLWSGEAEGRKMPRIPDDISRPRNAAELRLALESLIPERDKYRLRVVVIDILGSSLEYDRR